MWIVLESPRNGDARISVGPFIKREDAQAYQGMCIREADEEGVDASYEVVTLIAETVWGCVVPQE